MKKIGLLMILGFLVLSAAQAFAGSVAVVNFDRIVELSQPGKAAQDHLNQVHQVLQSSYEKMASMKDKLAGSMEEATAQLNAQFNVERKAVQDELKRLIGLASLEWLKKHPDVDCVVLNEQLLAYQKTIDVSEELLPYLNQLSPKFYPLPQVDLRPKP